METKDTFKISQEKGGKKKVKCALFFHEKLNRELAIHEDIDKKEFTTISDSGTGVKLFSLPFSVSTISQAQIDERLEKYIKHYTLEAITDGLTKMEKEYLERTKK